MIHPQALVDPGAELGRDVHVGPFSVIGSGVIVGDETWIGPHVVLNGPTRIGRANRIFQFSSIGEVPQHIGFRGESTRLEIGDSNVIREFCTVNRGTAEGGGVTRVGDHNFIMASCHIAHDCIVGNHTIFANGASLAGHVLVGDYAVLGGYSLVHQFCRLGAHCLTAIGTVLYKDVPPFVVAAGNSAAPHGINVRGLKRRQFSEVTIEKIWKAYKILYKSGYKLSEAIAQLKALASEFPDISDFVQFIQKSERGIVR
jgi:UDP-N-acetylglucosamine acyltransferase